MPDATADHLFRAFDRFEGEVRFDRKTRHLYSTDASIYRIMPLGVVFPRSIDDVVRATEIAAEEGVSLLPRGGGTSLAGQAVGESLVLDFSRFMDEIVEIDPGLRRARVQPGVRLDRLNRAALGCGLHFGPDPATLRQCAIGGMIGNNACGARSVVYGKTVDHVESLTCVLADGRVVRLGARQRRDTGGAEGELLREVLAAVEPHGDAIRGRYPRVPRRVSGYNLDMLLDDEVNLARLVVGSEGTLATVVEAELDLSPLPDHRGLVVLAFRDRFAPLDAVPAILEHGPSALEIIDDRVLRGAREVLEHRESAALVDPDAAGVLFVELSGADPEEVRERVERFAEAARRLPGDPRVGTYLRLLDQDRAWALRRAGLGLLYRTQGDLKPVPFVEDTGIPPERLGEYTRRFYDVVRRNDTTVGFFGHAGQGCLHLRVDLDLKAGEGVRRLRRIAEEVADLVVEFGGSLSGEHGDGLARSEFLPRLFGEEVMEVHRRVKRVFDPDGRMNPGKIVDAPPMDESLRFGEAYRSRPPETFFRYEKDGGWDRALEKCNGMGICRKLDEGTMCPSYMVTREEEHSTRGRANLLRDAMRGELDAMQSREVDEALSLCLACKACQSECPVGVDMSRYKAEFLAQKHTDGGAPRGARAIAALPEMARMGARTGVLGRAAARVFEPLTRRVAGMHPARTLPRLAGTTFRRSFRASGDGEAPVVLFDDTFHNHFEPAPLHAAAEVLGRAGFSVELPGRQVCCGRTYISQGLLGDARERLSALVDVLAPRAEAGAWIVGLEPSCILTLRDELPDLVDDPRTAVIAERSLTLEELLAESGYRPGRLDRRALVHGHCHQKAIVGMGPSTELLDRVEGLEYRVVDSGCCGMAGAFGYKRESYEVSIACAERVLAPAVRSLEPDDLVVASGFSCRSQIKDVAGRGSLHTAELLAMAR